MTTIIANPCSIPAIPRNGVINPKIVDKELVMKHLNRRFITNLGIRYHDRMQNTRRDLSDDELIDELTLHSYDDRITEKRGDRHIRNAILFDFTENSLKCMDGYINALEVVYNQQLMQTYLSNYAIPIVADWPGQLYIRKAIAQRLLVNNEIIPQYVTSFLPMMGPLHVSLNARELVFQKNSFLFNDIYKGIFGLRKILGKKPRPWRVDLILHIVRMAWSGIVDEVYLKFGYTCKNLEYLYMTDLLSNLIPLVLDVYAVHHRGGNWPAYEEACMRCWSDLFLRFDRRNYKRAPLMFFSDVFYWMETNHPMVDMITNHLASLSDCPVETVHSIIRRRTAKFSTAEQLQKEARFIFQQRHENTFREQFVKSVKYPYTPKQLSMLSQKCAIWLLDAFTKLYQARDQYPLIVETSSDGINTYELPSLGYRITDRHLPRGFVTSKKPSTAILCDYTDCDCSDHLFDGSILACGHGYHTRCLNKCQSKCFICLGYLQDEIKKNVDAMLMSMTKEVVGSEPIDENENVAEGDLSGADETTNDALMMEQLLEHAKKLFLEL